MAKFKITIENDVIKEVKVLRSTPCGSSNFIARKLIGLNIRDAPSLAGLYTQVYPCLATHSRDPLLKEEMIHLSGELMKKAVEIAVKNALNKL